ncbi:MAG: PAS domain S-box protein [Candidatus Omnitrophica bacterium]|nr:PAS domain S-box protein [Candidatus Omnitrophota bacterium]
MPGLSVFTFNSNTAWIHAGADLIMASAYFLAFLLIIRFLQKRRDFIRYRWSVGAFGIFLVLAGSLHILAIWAPWYPLYGVQGIFKLITATVSLLAISLLIWLLRKAVSIPGPEQIKERMHELKTQIVGHQRIQRELEKAREEVKTTLQERTQDLFDANQALERQIEERKHLEEEFRFLPELMREIAEAGDFLSALEMALRKVCQLTGWDYGEAWTPRGDGKALEFSSAWHRSDEWKEFRQISQELRFPPKLDLPGRVWVSKQPEWMQNVNAQTAKSFTRFSMAQEFGIRAAVGIPVLAQGQVVAILVFFTRESRREDGHLIHLVSAVATYLSSVLREKSAEEALRAAHEQLEVRIKERTEELTRINQALEREIAERTLAEESLRYSEKNYLTLVNSIEGIVWEYDLQSTKFTFVSEQAEKILGYPGELWFSEPALWQNHVHGRDRERTLSFRARVASEKRDDQCEYRMVSADGRVIWFRDMVTVVLENSDAVKLRGVMVDITEQKRVEEALNRERNFASAVLDTAGALVMILDTEGRIVRFNRAWQQISGYTLDEVKGKCFWDLFSVPEEVGKIKAIFARLLAGQFPTAYESYLIAKEGNRRVIAWSNTVLLNKDGSVDHVIATGIDVTNRMEIEQKLKEAVANLAHSNEELDRSSRELKEANERLQKMDEIKSQFISAASHELRTPLTSLKGYVETVLQGEAGPINPKQREFLNYVKESTDRLHRLLNELLDISKIESGQVKMVMELTNLRNLLREEIMVFKPQAEEKQISLFLEVDNKLRSVYCDADKIREVMDNLLSNAVKYTPKNGKVTIHARNHNAGGVQIDMEDTGIGISDHDLPRIFEPFQHIEKNETDNEESTGLGLTLVKKIVETHEGEIRVKSEEAKGSTFTIVLPLGHRSSDVGKSSWVMTP